MKLTEEKLKQIFQQQSARSTARQVDCLTEEQFSRAVVGAMSQEERSKVARHLITCADCTEEYRIVRSLKPWAAEAEQVLATSARDISPRPFTASPWSVASFASSARATLALAAMLFLVLFAAIFLLWSGREQSRELARLNQELAERERALGSVRESLTQTERRVRELEEANQREPDPSTQPAVQDGSRADSSRQDENVGSQPSLREPQLEVPIVDLDDSPVRGGTTRDATRIDIPSTANLFTLILNFSGESYPAYEVELLDNGGKRIWRGRVREKNQSRSITLTLNRSLVRNGDYKIKLYGLKDGTREGVAEYPFEVRSAVR